MSGQRDLIQNTDTSLTDTGGVDSPHTASSYDEMWRLAMAPDSNTNLPAELTSFVGRRRELREIRQLLSESRLVTLTGFGGVGKSKLALRVATDSRRAFPGGAWFVGIGELAEPSLLADSVARQLGMRGQSTRTVHRALVEFLGERETLLLLDNCEHLIDACAYLADGLLRACPKLRVLATSREPLRIAGETVCGVNPLSVPGREPPVDTILNEYESVRLFVDRARSALPGFALTDENRSDVASICSYLEGIPLALELAAVRIRAMSPSEVLQNLTNQWQLLTVGDRIAPDRQRTMRACVEWSFRLCSPDEQDLWAQASVFSGGFEIDAVEHLYGAADNPTDRQRVLDLVMSLTDKSILLREEYGGRVRHRMLETIRMHGTQRLADTGRLDEFRRLHRDWCADLAARCRAEWLGPEQASLSARIRHELPNLRAAIEYCTTVPAETDSGLTILIDLHDYTIAHGLFRPGRHLLERLLAQPPHSQLTRLSALRTLSWLTILQGELPAAEPLIAEGRALAASLDELARAFMGQVSGLLALFANDLLNAISQLEQARDVFRARDEQLLMVQTIMVLGLAYGFAGQPDKALEQHKECLAVTEAAGETWWRSQSLWNAGLIHLTIGDRDAATTLERQSLRLKRSLDDRLGIALCFEALAWITAATDASRAATLLGAADALWKRMGTSTANLPGLALQREACERDARQALGDSFTTAFDRGLTLGHDAAIEFALGEARTVKETHAPNAAGSVALTKRERQIAELVARGLSNKEIAAELVIAVRTAETHVEHILTKLGFTSRIQIATWVTENQK